LQSEKNYKIMRISWLLVFVVLLSKSAFSMADKPVVHLELVPEVKGEEVHYHVLAGEFVRVVSLQGTFSWSLDSMSFTRIAKYGLPGMNSSNFNTEVAEQGNILISWFTMDVRNGVTMEACDTLITFVFEAQHGPSDLRIVSDPLFIEFHNSSLEELELKYDIRKSCSYARTGFLREPLKPTYDFHYEKKELAGPAEMASEVQDNPPHSRHFYKYNRQ